MQSKAFIALISFVFDYYSLQLLTTPNSVSEKEKTAKRFKQLINHVVEFEELSLYG